MHPKYLTILLGIMLIITGSVSAINTTPRQTLSKRAILYVGGSGAGNYTRIQDAIDNASNGDTVFVYDDSSPYLEHILITHSINLIGENKTTTIIDGNWSGIVVNISADSTIFSGFTIQWGYRGIRVLSNNNTITNNILINNHRDAIQLIESHESIISYNTIIDNGDGIDLDTSHKNLIINNTINFNGDGIELDDSCNNDILKNSIVSNEDQGIEIVNSPDEEAGNLIKNNHIESNINGIVFEDSNTNNILRNNFISNYRAATFINCNNIWVHNFWENDRLFPKIIFGKTEVGTRLLPWINIDWYPAHEPFDIG